MFNLDMSVREFLTQDPENIRRLTSDEMNVYVLPKGHPKTKNLNYLLGLKPSEGSHKVFGTPTPFILTEANEMENGNILEDMEFIA